jgi:hypothetical protein
MRHTLFSATVVSVFGLMLSLPASALDDQRLLTRRSTNRISISSGNTPAMGDFETLNFRGAAACSPCHSINGNQDASRGDSEPSPAMYDQWSASIMGYGSKDPLWQAKVTSEVLRAPEDWGDYIEGKCSTCHTPMATAEARNPEDPQDVLLFGEDGFLNPDHPLHGAAMDGISCTLCHRIEDSPALGTDEGMSGAYTIAYVEEPVDRPHYGRYEDTFDQPMRSSVGMLNAFGRQISDPALCATCHNLKTPFFDGDGNIAEGEFPEQTPFSEWQASDSAAGENPMGCQKCHMASQEEGTLASKPGWLPKRERPPHDFISANTEILQLLAAETADAGGDPGPLLASAEKGRDLLKDAGTLELLDPSFGDGILEFKLLVGNLTGHKLPTAFPSRRIFLHVVVRDAEDSDTIAFESGAMREDGWIEGDDYDVDSGAWEPHHLEISSPEQVQIYETILGTTDYQPTCTLLRAAHYLKDNRITPIGFDPYVLEVPEDVLPVGECEGDGDFGPGSDAITYNIAGLTRPGYTVTVELRHQAIGWPYVNDLREFEEDPVVARFLNLYDTVLPGSEVMAELEIRIGD